jgi:hypothetical protein
MLRGQPAEDVRSTSLAVIPHFVLGGRYGSFINLINPDTQPVNLEVSAHDNQGNTMGETIKLVLQPGEMRRSSVGEFFRLVLPAIFPQPVITGYIRIREASSRNFVIAGAIDIFGLSQSARGDSMLSAISDDASTSWRVPFSAGTAEYYTGYAVVAANELLTVQTDVIVDVVGPEGNVLNRSTYSLSPRHRITALVPDGTSGYLRITSNLPVFVMSTIGSHDSKTLEQIPATR